MKNHIPWVFEKDFFLIPHFLLSSLMQNKQMIYAVARKTEFM